MSAEPASALDDVCHLKLRCSKVSRRSKELKIEAHSHSALMVLVFGSMGFDVGHVGFSEIGEPKIVP